MGGEQIVVEDQNVPYDGLFRPISKQTKPGFRMQERVNSLPQNLHNFGSRPAKDGSRNGPNPDVMSWTNPGKIQQAFSHGEACKMTSTTNLNTKSGYGETAQGTGPVNQVISLDGEEMNPANFMFPNGKQIGSKAVTPSNNRNGQPLKSLAHFDSGGFQEATTEGDL
mmetsp:Transcript_40331/g.61538  ORF Transcript_40331/g.61538 Transcript_40331/m.61538 type:complete len:167 (-) Transcript_40331:298-798(-)|eukprot:CAMPEP_0170507486 /NCGR_PEP_ID=MMETSP0208-20121228/59004_1 /TAXON_ID=197538 /ORGANISM="Strombidium inclinatum, Strain S3" /LENGTH=166 /DNA_ID=CAMNT_0010789705 /DNA_START=79 /DNA_END=579 /DNA_ORIENTATION=-